MKICSEKCERLGLFRERIYQLERKEMEIEMEERKQVEEKKNKINEAARKQDEPVDDSKLVEAMFDFLPDSSSEAPTPGGIERLISSLKMFSIYFGFFRS